MTKKNAPKTVEDQFDQLADAISALCAEVDCTPEEYRDGLLTVIERLQLDRRASKESDPYA
jgi:hypothetical protein